MFCGRGIILFSFWILKTTFTRPIADLAQNEEVIFYFIAYRIKNTKRLSILFFFGFQFTLRKLQNNSSMFTKKNVVGPTEIWTRIAGFRVQSANHYTMGPFAWQISENGGAFF